MFKWIDATEIELAVHISKLSAQAVHSQIRYYKGVGNHEMIDKIKKARKIANFIRAERRLESMKNELSCGETK